jgi:hypothetical protein
MTQKGPCEVHPRQRRQGATTVEDVHRSMADLPLVGAAAREGQRRGPMNMGRSWCMAMALVLSALAVSVHADVSPGDKINATNVEKAKDLISPGLEWCIKRGLPITVVESKRVEWPKAYKEATEKYASQVTLSADGLTVVKNYVAGQPFPNVDPKDPQVALKIMWNFEYGFANGIDDTDLRNFDADTGSIPPNGPMTVERHFLLDHLRRLFWTGRLYVDPKPEKPNPNGYRVQQGLYPILEPFDLKGVGALGNRYTDSAKQDDSWLYLPSLRRVRRLSTAQRSDALFGQDADVDSYYGYAGHISWMDWKYLGEKEILGIVHAEHFPVKWDSKVDWAFDDVWEKRKVYVIEGTSKLPQYAYSKRMLLIDKETWGIPSRTPTSTTAPASCGRSGSTTSAGGSRSPGTTPSSTRTSSPSHPPS